MKTKLMKYQDDIYAIDQESARSFLIIGREKALLFDAGIEPINIMELIRTVTKLPIIFVLSHADPDHIANADKFETIFAHEKEIARCKEIEALKTKRYVVLKDLDYINLGDKNLKVIFIPGHSKGHIGLIDEITGDFFAGDTLSYGPIFLFVPNADILEYKKTLYQLKDRIYAGEIKKVYSCHNECPIVPETVNDLLKCCEGYEDGTLRCITPKEPLPFEGDIHLYKVNQCGILV